MAEEDTPQEEKTEEPTARRLEKAKEEGQVLRSQDMTIAAVTISVIATLYLGGFWMEKCGQVGTKEATKIQIPA